MERLNSLSRDVIEAIKSREVIPIPRWQILLHRSVFWISAILSILIGALAFSVTDYVFFDNEGVGASALIESPLEGILQGAPLLWLIVSAVFMASAYISLRKTRSGYKIRPTFIIGSVLLSTIILGLFLDLFDFGHGVYYYLTHQTSVYEAFKQTSDDISI
jgi:uncharacterized membrane protein